MNNTNAEIQCYVEELVVDLDDTAYFKIPGEKGADGKSAYELAVEQGYDGSLEDWLASLKGKDGDEVTSDSIANALGYAPVKPSDIPTADINANTAARHGHANKTVLDSITGGKVDIWDAKASKATATAGADGLMSAADKAKLDGVEAGATKTTVDASLDSASTNPVQNKAVKEALDGKLNGTKGIGDVQNLKGTLHASLSLEADSSINVGKNDSIHLFKDGNGVAKLTYGSAGEDGTAPMARMKLAPPTENDDAATKAYVDGKAVVRYDAEQALGAAQQSRARENIGAASIELARFKSYVTLTPPDGALGHGVGLSTTVRGNSHEYALDISDVDEDEPTLLTGIATPTDANTNAAATVEYVKAKIAAIGSGTDGESAYELAKQEGYTGTLTEWLASLKGAKGDKGDKGESGITPTIGANGNWFLGTTDTGKPARGEKGDKGDPGESGSSSLDAPVLTSPILLRREGETDMAGIYLTTVATGYKTAEIELADANEDCAVAIRNLRTPTGTAAALDSYAATKAYVDGKVAAVTSGQSAYAAAQTGGYTGAQADFYADLAAMQGLAAALAAM